MARSLFLWHQGSYGCVAGLSLTCLATKQQLHHKIWAFLGFMATQFGLNDKVSQTKPRCNASTRKRCMLGEYNPMTLGSCGSKSTGVIPKRTSVSARPQFGWRPPVGLVGWHAAGGLGYVASVASDVCPAACIMRIMFEAAVTQVCIASAGHLDLLHCMF